MRKRVLLRIGAISAIVAGAAIWLAGRPAHVHPYTNYSESRLVELGMSAKEGDVDAVRRLHNYFAFVRYSPREMERWLRVGVEHKDQRSIRELALFKTNMDSTEEDLAEASRLADALGTYDRAAAEEVRREIALVRSAHKTMTR